MRILVADDHEVVRHGVRALLEARPGWQVVAEAVDGREAVEKSKRLQPDVIILDIGMPGLNGLDAARQKAAPKSGILILTMHESEQVVREVLAAGARGYVLKSDAGRDLVNAVEAVGRQRIFFTSSVAQVVLKRSLGRNNEATPLPAEPVSLTHREREVVQLLGEGKSNKEVADILGISVRTAETHRSNIMHKLECGSLSDLVRYAIRNHIITV